MTTKQGSRTSRFVRSAVRIAVAAGLGYAVLVLLIQRAVMYPGQWMDAARPDRTAPAGVEQIWLTTSGGPVESWLIAPADRPPRAAVIFAHGNGEMIDNWKPEMDVLAEAGVLSLIVEYPGYGFSAGRPSRSTISEAFAAAYDSLALRSESGGVPIVGWGRSLGGGAIVDLSAHRPFDALILQSTFSSAARMARAGGVPGFLLRDRFDNESGLTRFTGPVLLMHGPTDNVIPFEHARRLAGAASDATLEELPCGHNDCGGHWDMIVAIVDAFLREALGA